jgi:hypothetical protein
LILRLFYAENRFPLLRNMPLARRRLGDLDLDPKLDFAEHAIEVLETARDGLGLLSTT